jgi:hypothetical protein
MFKRLALEGQFDLGDDQAVVFAVKDVDFPHLVSDSLSIPRLLDEGARELCGKLGDGVKKAA